MPENPPSFINLRARAGAGALRRKPPCAPPRGFTLIELLVVIAIMAILATLAAPSFMGLIANANVSRAVNGFISDTRYARGEGMRRGKSVSICRSSNPLATNPGCSTGDGLAAGGWMEGWVVFADEDGDGSFDSGIDTVLRVQEQVSGISDFFAVGATTASAVSTGNRIVYDATGRAVGQQGRWLVHAAGSFGSNAAYTRTLCMNSVGRVRVSTGELAC